MRMATGQVCPAVGRAVAGAGAFLAAALFLAAGVDRVAVAAAAPAAVPFDRDGALATSQAAIGRQVGDYRFTDRFGRPLRLAELRGRPVVISLIYSSCSHTCPMLTRNLERIVRVAREALGEGSFSVLTIGFDTAKDTPRRMASFARQQGIDLADWWVLSADAATMAGLVRDLGFVYFASPKGFDHLAQTTVLDSEGRVYRQIYGRDIEVPLLVDPLKALVFGTETPFASLEDLVKKVRLFCTVYDPASDRYRFDYSLFIGMFIGLMSLGGIGFVLVRGWLRLRRTERRAG